MQNKQQLKIHSERLSAVHKEVQGLRHEMNDRLKSMRSEVVDLLNEQTNQLKLLFKQHTDLVESLQADNVELKAEVERLRRF